MANTWKVKSASKTIAKPKLWSFYDKTKKSHLYILSLSIQYGWSKQHPKTGNEVADLLSLSNWLKSDKSPIKKPLMEMSATEVSKIIVALENMVSKKHAG